VWVKFLVSIACLAGVFAAFGQQTQPQTPPLREGNFDIRFEPTAVLQAGSEIRFDITVKDADHNLVHGAKVTLQIETADHHSAKIFRATELQTGVYMSKPIFPAAGRWIVYVDVRRGEQMSARSIEFYVAK
jgi:hypothetical protein